MTHISGVIHQFRSRLLTHCRIWLTAVIVSGVLLLSAVLAFKASGNQLMTLLLLVFGVGVVILVLNNPVIGLLLILFNGFYVSFTGPGGLNIAMLWSAFLLVIWLLNMLIRQKSFTLKPTRANVPILIFVVIAILSFINGQLPWYAFANQAPLDAQVAGLAIFIISAGVFLLSANQINDLVGLKRVTWVFLVLGGIYILGRLLGPYGGIITSLYHQKVGAGSMFWTWLIALSFSQVAYNRRLDPRARIALGFLFLASLYVAYFQAGDWKSGWIPPLVAVLAILALRHRRLALALAPLGVLPGLIFVRQAIATDFYSWITRLEAWRIVLEISRANPVLGLGFANYRFYTPLFPILGWYVEFNAHSQYVDLIAQTGILGLLAFLWIFWEVGRLGWQLRNVAPPGFEQAYVYGVLGGLAGTLVAAALVDWVLPFVYNITLQGFRASVLAWLFMGGLVSLAHTLQQNKTSSGETDA